MKGIRERYFNSKFRNKSKKNRKSRRNKSRRYRYRSKNMKGGSRHVKRSRMRSQGGAAGDGTPNQLVAAANGAAPAGAAANEPKIMTQTKSNVIIKVKGKKKKCGSVKCTACTNYKCVDDQGNPKRNNRKSDPPKYIINGHECEVNNCQDVQDVQGVGDGNAGQGDGNVGQGDN